VTEIIRTLAVEQDQGKKAGSLGITALSHESTEVVEDELVAPRNEPHRRWTPGHDPKME
jgi:hypothetical protein